MGKLTTLDKLGYMTKVLGAIQEALPGVGTKVQLMVLAHSAYETGYGKSKAFKGGKNLFNITRGLQDPRPTIVGPDFEFTKDGKKAILQRFALYGDFKESVQHYWEFIDKPKYRPARDLLVSEDLGGYITALSKGGYFTLPLVEYLAGYAKIYAEVAELSTKLRS